MRGACAVCSSCVAPRIQRCESRGLPLVTRRCRDINVGRIARRRRTGVLTPPQRADRLAAAVGVAEPRLERHARAQQQQDEQEPERG